MWNHRAFNELINGIPLKSYACSVLHFHTLLNRHFVFCVCDDSSHTVLGTYAYSCRKRCTIFKISVAKSKCCSKNSQHKAEYFQDVQDAISVVMSQLALFWIFKFIWTTIQIATYMVNRKNVPHTAGKETKRLNSNSRPYRAEHVSFLVESKAWETGKRLYVRQKYKTG